MILQALQLTILLAITTSKINGQVTSDGKCAIFDSKGKFSISQFFSGNWYVVEGYPNRFHNDKVCQEFKMTNSGKYVYINETVYDTVKNQFRYIPGSGKFSKKGNMNHLTMTPGLKSLPVNSHFWVVATDYNTYGLIYICEQLENKINKKREYMYVVSRTPSIRPGVRARIILDNIVRAGFPVAPLAPMNQMDCPTLIDVEPYIFTKKKSNPKKSGY